MGRHRVEPTRARVHRRGHVPDPALQAGAARGARVADRRAAGRGGRRGGGTVPGLNEDLLRRLYATPPPEFVAARNELVKALRKERRRDEATTLAALRRPTWEDWALNAVATSEPGATAAFVDAAAHVRDAQTAAVEGRAGPDVRGALRELREASGALVRLADAALGGAGRQAVAGAVNARLADVAASDDDGSRLAAGILGSDTEPPARPRRAAPSRRPAPDAEPPAPPRPAPPPAPPEPPGPTKAQREAAAEAVRRHTTAVKARERVAATVERLTAELDEARAALEHALADEEAAAAAADAARVPGDR